MWRGGESMKYLIDSYTAYMVNGGLLDKGSEVVNWFFIELPFLFAYGGNDFLNYGECHESVRLFCW